MPSKPHPSVKIFIEQDKRRLWHVVAIRTTRAGLERGGGSILSDAFKTSAAARPEFEQVLKAQSWVKVSL